MQAKETIDFISVLKQDITLLKMLNPVPLYESTTVMSPTQSLSLFKGFAVVLIKDLIWDAPQSPGRMPLTRTTNSLFGDSINEAPLADHAVVGDSVWAVLSQVLLRHHQAVLSSIHGIRCRQLRCQ